MIVELESLPYLLYFLVQLSLQKTVTALRLQVETMEQSLTQERREVENKTSLVDHTEREFSSQIQTLQEQLSSVQSKSRQETGQLSEKLKEVVLSSSQAQKMAQTKEQVKTKTTKKQ